MAIADDVRHHLEACSWEGVRQESKRGRGKTSLPHILIIPGVMPLTPY